MHPYGVQKLEGKPRFQPRLLTESPWARHAGMILAMLELMQKTDADAQADPFSHVASWALPGLEAPEADAGSARL